MRSSVAGLGNGRSHAHRIIRRRWICGMSSERSPMENGLRTTAKADASAMSSACCVRISCCCVSAARRVSGKANRHAPTSDRRRSTCASAVKDSRGIESKTMRRCRPAQARLWNRSARRRHTLAAAPTPPPAEAPNESRDLAESFVGELAHAQSCGRKHSATLRIRRESGRKVAGTWDDGNLTRGSHGALTGEVHDDKLHLRFCRDTQGKDSGSCPGLAVETPR